MILLTILITSVVLLWVVLLYTTIESNLYIAHFIAAVLLLGIAGTLAAERYKTETAIHYYHATKLSYKEHGMVAGMAIPVTEVNKWLLNVQARDFGWLDPWYQDEVQQLTPITK